MIDPILPPGVTRRPVTPAHRGGARKSKDGADLFVCRISDEVVRQIRRDRAGQITLSEIARKYNVSKAYVSLLCSGHRRRVGR